MIMINSFSWTLFSTVFGNVIQIISLLLIAKVVGPEVFGVFSFALVLYGFVLIFQDVGIGAFIIKEQNISDCQVRAASHLAIIFGVITFFVFIIVIQFFNKGDSFQYICYAISLNFPILGLSIANKAMLEKIGDFSKIGKLEACSSAASGIVSLISLYYISGVFSLVALGLVKSIINTLGYVYLYRINIIKRADYSRVGDSIKFSKGVFGFNFFNYFSRNLDKYLISVKLGDYWLGGYSLAYRFLQYPLQLISQVVSRVMFPKLSKVIGLKEFDDLIIKTICLLVVAIYPFLALSAAAADNVVLFFFNHEWLYISEILFFFSICATVQVFGVICGPVFLAKGRTKEMFYVGLFNSIVYALSFYIGSLQNVVVLTEYYTYANFLVFPLTCYVLLKFTGIKLYELIWLVIVSSFIFVTSYIGNRYIWLDFDGFWFTALKALIFTTLLSVAFFISYKRWSKFNENISF